MSDRTNYLYDDKHSETKKRLRGLENIEDENTIDDAIACTASMMIVGRSADLIMQK